MTHEVRYFYAALVSMNIKLVKIVQRKKNARKPFEVSKINIILPLVFLIVPLVHSKVQIYE